MRSQLKRKLLKRRPWKRKAEQGNMYKVIESK